MLDKDLAILYKVSTGRLNEQVKRNKKRFPSDFMFQLTKEEFKHLKSQIATLSLGWSGGGQLKGTAFHENKIACRDVCLSFHHRLHHLIWQRQDG